MCLNLADDHLEWHGSFEAYRDAKAHVYDNTRVACVYNKADAATRAMVEDAEVVEGARAIGFDLGVPGPSDLGVVDGILVDRAFLEDRRTSALELTTVAELAEQGLAAPHIVAEHPGRERARALARCPAARRSARRCAASASTRTASRSSRSTAASTWVDDSKATNPHAAASSLAAYPGAVWVVGGLLKGVDISDLVAGRGGDREGGDRDRRRPRPRSSPRSSDTRPRCPCSRSRPMRLKRSWRGSSNWRQGSRVTGTWFCSPPPRHPSTSSPPTPTAVAASRPRCRERIGRGTSGDARRSRGRGPAHRRPA